MKRDFFIAIIVAIMVIFIPTYMLNNIAGTNKDSSVKNLNISNSESASQSSIVLPDNGERITIYDSATEKTTKLSLAEYALGAIASEMPATYHEQALIAQGAAAISYAKYSGMKGLSGMTDVDIVVNSAERKGFMTNDGILNYYGADGEKMLEILKSAASKASQIKLTYNNQPVAAAYHAISCGMTENAENLWGEKIPYLITVTSPADVMSDKYRSTVLVSKDELEKLAEKLEIKLLGNIDTWLKVLEESEAGYVKTMRFGNKEITGAEAREHFGLRSACFSMIQQGEAIAFYVRGYGHGCGMSQNGADFLAKEGKTAQEILSHYYPGITIT